MLIAFSILILLIITSLFIIDFNNNPLVALQIKQQNYILLMQQSNATSAYQLNMFNPSSFVDFIKVSYQALLVAYIRPFPWELHNNPFMLLSMLENLFVISLLIWIIYHIIKDKLYIDTSISTIWISIFIYVNFIYLLSAMIAMNFGTLMRYKMPALLFLLIGVFLLFPPKISEKIEKHLK